MTFFSISAVIVGCLPPFKSLFRGSRSFRRCSSPTYDKNSPPGLHLDAIGFDSAGTASAGTVADAKAAQHAFHDGYEDEQEVPRGAIRVRSDYVSRCIWRLRGESAVTDCTFSIVGSELQE